MMRVPLSAAASALLRALVERAEVPRDRILLSEWRSTDWQSLTFIGERHEIVLRLCGAEAGGAWQRIANGLAEAEFTLPGHVLADIAVIGEPKASSDGSLAMSIEALTIAEQP
jgi:hypothetical protein